MSIAIVDSDAVPVRRLALADKPPGATDLGAAGATGGLPASVCTSDQQLRTGESASGGPVAPLADHATSGGMGKRSLPVCVRAREEDPPLSPLGKGGRTRPEPSSPVIEDANRTEIVDRLRKRLEDYRHRRARQAGWTRRFVPTGLAAIDAALPRGGLPCGAMTEILADDAGVGAMTLALRIARRCAGMVGGDTYHDFSIQPTGAQNALADKPPVAPARLPPVRKNHGQAALVHATQYSLQESTGGQAASGTRPLPDGRGTDGRGFVVVVDTANDFYPPAARQHGVDLHRLIVVRVRHRKEAFWAVEQALRCRAVAAVIAPLTHLDEGQSRRLQLAAEGTGCVGLILRPARQQSKSFAAIRIHVTGVPPTRQAGSAKKTTGKLRLPMPPDVRNLDPSKCRNRDAYWCRIELLTVREGMPVEPILVDLHHETGDVPVHPVPVNRPAARTG